MTRWRPTPKQRACLDALAGTFANGPGMSVPALAAKMSTSNAGAAETASSLVRRGLVARRYTHDSLVRYYLERKP